MIDQAAQGNFQEAYNKMQPGTVIYIHTIFPLHPWTFKTFKERIGASEIGPNSRFLKKERNASKEDFEIASAVYKILVDPIHEVPFIQEIEPPEEYIRRIKDTLYSELDEKFGLAIAKAQAGILFSTSQSKYQYIETSDDSEPMSFDTFLARINNPSTDIQKKNVTLNRFLKILTD